MTEKTVSSCIECGYHGFESEREGVCIDCEHDRALLRKFSDHIIRETLAFDGMEPLVDTLIDTCLKERKK